MHIQIHSALVGSVLLATVLAGLAACSTVRLGQNPYSSALEAGNENGEVRYLLYLPDTYGKDRSVKWPLVMFLHGRGECGKDLELLKNHPLPKNLPLPAARVR